METEINYFIRQHHHGAQTASVWEIEASLSHMVVALKIKKEEAFVICHRDILS